MAKLKLRESVHFHTKLPPAGSWSEGTVLLYDEHLSKVSPEFRAWAKTFGMSMRLKAGESLKTLATLTKVVDQFAKLTTGVGKKDLRILAAGGGSVTDFCGFLASVYQRGVALELLPTTWLAALDSAHGGKNGLNLGTAKNQIGSFYLPEKVHIVNSVLEAQPALRAQEAMGELAKTALLNRELWKACTQSEADGPEMCLLKNLSAAIAVKYQIVKRDPFEKQGHRQILNLGHTFGHVVELLSGVAHGEAVAFGLLFALRWSEYKSLLSANERARIESSLQNYFYFEKSFIDKPLPKKAVAAVLARDKKSVGAGGTRTIHSFDTFNTVITFIFLRGVGRPVREQVSIHAIVNELVRQGWCR